MKYLLLCLLLVSCLGSNDDQVKDAESGAKTEMSADSAESEDANGFVEENDECICTKEYKPVCGSDGKVYPSACQANCEGVSEFTEGVCSDEGGSDEMVDNTEEQSEE